MMPIMTGVVGEPPPNRKKNGKKADLEPVPDPSKIELEEEPKASVLDDDWGFGTSKKDKKKGKVTIEEALKVEETFVSEKAESVVAEEDTEWGSWGIAKKDKKKAAKAKDESPEPIVVSTAFTKALEPAADNEWIEWVSILYT